MSITGFAGMRNLSGLELELTPPDEVYAGIAAPFTLRVHNRKRQLPSFLLSVRDGESSVQFAWVARRGDAAAVLPLTFPERGPATLATLTVASPFPVNFFVRFWRLPVNCALLVFPRPLPCAGLVAEGDGAGGSGGRRPTRGSGGEVERIEEYSGREPLKQIHWKLTARDSRIKVKRYVEAAATPLVIDPAELPGGLEERISCAAWLIRRWGEERPVGLRLTNEYYAPQQGRRQIRSLLAALACCKG